MKHIQYILFLALLTIASNSLAQYDPSSVARLEDGKVIYKLDMRWTEVQKKEVVRLFDLDSTVWQKLTSNKTEIILDSTRWNVRKLSSQVVELSKNIEKKPVRHLNAFDIFLADDKRRIPPGYVDQEKVIYGFNSFSRRNVYNYEKGEARFYLPGFEKTKHAYIAGSFNNWDPKKTVMHFVDSGWMVKITLSPGKYFYKFILDGNWMTDPNNRFEENDGQGNINSVLYCSNFQFKLNGYKNAKKVIVAGSFNNWNRNEIKMHRTTAEWILPMYLKDGSYSYKFLVDDEWVTDPANKATRTDAQGNKNSVISRGDEYVFRLKGFEKAKRVVLTGNFNKWNPEELLMEKTSEGWRLPYNFAPGNYEYKFIVDGRWITDPANLYTSGSGNNKNSCLSYKANHTFKLTGFPNAREVIVTGTFKDWDSKGYRMVKQNGVWSFPIYLPEGKHLYKFILDGQWILDPANKLWEQNEFGTGNSILWIK